MKNTQRKSIRKISALFVVLTMLASILQIGTVAVHAAPAAPTLTHDVVTVDDWQTLYTPYNTENAGSIWTDKSVVSEDNNAATVDSIRGQTAQAGEFLVGLSGIGSSLDLQTNTATPTDTILLLDASSSMGGNRAQLSRAVNEVIDNLMNLHDENRVALVFYSSQAETLLPLGHYEQTRTTGIDHDNKYISYGSGRYTMSSGLTRDGVAVTGTHYVSTGNGTNQQSAMISAMNIFNSATAAEKSGNIPVMVLMSDGEASVSNTNFKDGQSGTSISTFGRTGSTEVSTRQVTFFTQLTASYVKNQIDAAYTNKLYIYSLCFNTDDALARLLLNLDVSASNLDVAAVNTYWNNYNNAAVGDNVPIANSGDPTFNVIKENGHNPSYVEPEGAFEADTDLTGSNGLIATFGKIFEKIESISALDYVTHVDPIGANMSGYVSFVDHIGEYMEVDTIRGVMIDEHLYDGELFAEAFYGAEGAFGTVAEPTILGDEFVRSIRTRLGLMDNTALDEEAERQAANARTHALIQNAYESGQLAYANESFSNYFGWYSDKDYKCIGAWNDRTDPDGKNYAAVKDSFAALGYPGNADAMKYLNKSYLFLGHDGDTGVMYISVRVSRDVSTGEETVAFAVPASIFPVVRYRVHDEQDSGTVTMEYNTSGETPVTLFYEVKPTINSDTLPLVKASYTAVPENIDGDNIKFYTNKWKHFEPDISNKIDPSNVQDYTYSYFRPNDNNRKYYFTNPEGTIVYRKTGADTYEVYTGDALWNSPGDTNEYAYKETVYVKNKETGVVTAEDAYFNLNKHTLTGNNVTGDFAAEKKGENWIIPKGAIHRHMSRFAKNKEDSTFTTSLTRYLIPFVEDNSAAENTIIACAALGNNGRAMISSKNADGVKTGGILLKKEFVAGVEDTNATFQFTLEAAGITTANLYKLNSDGVITENLGEITFTSNKATINIKAGESIYIGGLPVGSVKVTEEPHVQYTFDTVQVGSDTPVALDNATVGVEDAKYKTVLFTNKIKPETIPIPVLINYLNEDYKDRIEKDCVYTTYAERENYLNTIAGLDTEKSDEILQTSHADDDYVSDTDEPFINYIPQKITSSGINYIKTGYTIIEDGTDPSKGIVINEYYAKDELDDPGEKETGGDGIADKYQAVAKFDKYPGEEGTVGGITTQVFTLTDYDPVTKTGGIHPLVRNAEYGYDIVTTTPDTGFIFDHWATGIDPSAADATPVDTPQKTITVAAESTTYFWAYFDPDYLDDPGDTINEDGDDIPDKYQAVVEFVSEDVAKGTVTGTGILQVFTLLNSTNNPVETGDITPSIANVAVTPQSGYVFDSWTLTVNGVPVDNPPLPEETRTANGGDRFVYTAHFVTAPTPPSGGGSGSINGTLEITKTVQAPDGFEAADSYTFYIYKSSSGKQEIYKEIEVKVGTTNRITLPAGTYYIEEDESAAVDGYVVNLKTDLTDDMFTIMRGRTTKLDFENVYTSKQGMLEKDDHHAYIIGYPDGDVRPNAGITRAEVATIFFRMMTDEAREAFGRNENSFTDVSKSNWFNIAISTLENAKILDGYNDGTFRPNEPITRAELSKIAASFYEAQSDKTVNFSDINGHWAEKFIESAYSYGFIDGYPDGTFKPDQHITRAETMKIVNATLERTPHKDYLHDDMIKWPDNSNKDEWYYADVQEATNSHDYKKQSGNEVWTKILPVRDWAALEITE